MIEQEDILKEDPDVAQPRRKYPWAIFVVALLFVLIPFFSWYGTWFGRPLSDANLQQYLNDKEKPRSVQHALAQIGNRIIEGDQTVKRWYSSVVTASEHPTPEVRMTAAWVMGQDNSYEEFRGPLLALLRDEQPGVRHNAALSLVRFNDSAARAELVAMLESRVIRAETAGTVELFMKEEGTAVGAGAPLVRIKQSDGSAVEIHAEEAGRIELLAVADGKAVAAGDELIVLSPDTEQVWEALRALFIIGQPEDIPHIERYARPISSMPDRIQKQAIATMDAIRTRAQQAGVSAQ